VDANDEVWFGTGLGLYNLHEKKGKYSLRHFDQSDGFKKIPITALKYDKQGGLWIGTSGDGAYLLRNNHFEHLDLKTNSIKPTINDFCFDQKGQVWLASLSGIGTYHTENKSVSWLSENEGLMYAVSYRTTVAIIGLEHLVAACVIILANNSFNMTKTLGWLEITFTVYLLIANNAFG
jgi:ligand-binding sensor domain-containing protein